MKLLPTASQTVGPYLHIGLAWLTIDRVAPPGCPGHHLKIRGRVLDGDGVPVAAGRVGLPDLHKRVRDRPAVLIQNTAADDDPLANRLAVVLAREVMVAGLDFVPAKNRSGDLR